MNLNIFSQAPQQESELGLEHFLSLHTASLEQIPIKLSRFDRQPSDFAQKSESKRLKLHELINNFVDLPHLSKRLFKNLKKAKFESPLPIQSLSFPLLLKGQNVICVAKTGSGKTLSFLLPIFIRLNYYYKKNFWKYFWNNCEEPKQFFKREVYTLSSKPKLGVSVLILVPSKELAIQIYEVAKKLGRKTQIKTGILLSEDSKRDQFKVFFN